MKHAAAYSSQRHDWATPQAFFDALNREFRFDLDAAASDHNAKCAAFYTIADDALTQPWSGSVWLNPPYGPGIGKWIAYAYLQAQRHGGPIVCLIPARTETSWWHEFVMRASEVRLVKGRMVFEIPNAEGPVHNAPFPSCIVVFRQGDHTPSFRAMDRANGSTPLFAGVRT